MNIRILTVIVLLASLFLAGCGTASEENVVQAAVEPDVTMAVQDDTSLEEDQTKENPDGSMDVGVPEAPQAIQLALGTFKLDETSTSTRDLAVFFSA